MPYKITRYIENKTNQCPQHLKVDLKKVKCPFKLNGFFTQNNWSKVFYFD